MFTSNACRYNLLLDTDSYKASHWLQYPPNVTSMFSYVESRGGKFPATVMFGLQYVLKAYLETPITQDDVKEAAEFYAGHGEPFNEEGWMHIVNVHKGFLPVRIRAVPEGTLVPTHNVLMTIESTDSKVFWVASFLETLLLRAVWYGTTVATQSYFCKLRILDSLRRTSDNPEGEIAFKLHDFGARGASSYETASIGGAAHLVNFMGSDTVSGVRLANKYYFEKMAAFSIPAAEHSTITAWGKDGEARAYANMLKQFAKPGSVVAVVSDSYDLFNAIENIWGRELKRTIIESGATVVIRPDSGDPATIVVKTLELLDEAFGSAINSKGYRVLNNVRVMQGDGINYESLGEILSAIEGAGYSVTNVAFGMGGALLQGVNRDTQKFAMKCSSITINEREVDVFKSPATDTAKKSKKGRLELICNGASWKTISLSGMSPEERAAIEAKSALVQVFENGKVSKEWSFSEVRANAAIPKCAMAPVLGNKINS